MCTRAYETRGFYREAGEGVTATSFKEWCPGVKGVALVGDFNAWVIVVYYPRRPRWLTATTLLPHGVCPGVVRLPWCARPVCQHARVV